MNKESLEKIEDYIKYNIEIEREKFNEVLSRIFNATIAYQYLCTVTDKNLKLDQIHEKHSDLVLIGPESGFLTVLLEKPFWKVKKHSENMSFFMTYLGTFIMQILKRGQDIVMLHLCGYRLL